MDCTVADHSLDTDSATANSRSDKKDSMLPNASRYNGRCGEWEEGTEAAEVSTGEEVGRADMSVTETQLS